MPETMMIPAPFDYHAPTTLADALALMGRLGPDAKLLAGGHSLLPMMKLRFAQPAHLVDLNRIDALRGIREEQAAALHGPAGLNLGGKTPPEIALAILAEMTALRRGQSLGAALSDWGPSATACRIAA
jgi:hypothetical protein